MELFPRLKLTPTKLNAAEQWISLLFYFLLEEYLTWLIFCIPNYLLNLKNHLTRLHQPCPAWGRPAWVSRSGDTGMELQRGEEGLLFASFLEAVRYFFPVCAPTRLGYSLQFRDITWTGSVPVPVRCKGHIYFHEDGHLHLQVWIFLKQNLPYHGRTSQTTVAFYLGSQVWCLSILDSYVFTSIQKAGFLYLLPSQCLPHLSSHFVYSQLHLRPAPSGPWLLWSPSSQPFSSISHWTNLPDVALRWSGASPFEHPLVFLFPSTYKDVLAQTITQIL